MAQCFYHWGLTVGCFKPHFSCRYKQNYNSKRMLSAIMWPTDQYSYHMIIWLKNTPQKNLYRSFSVALPAVYCSHIWFLLDFQKTRATLLADPTSQKRLGEISKLVITIWYMINSCDTWSTGFHGNDQCLSCMINGVSWTWSTVVIHDQQWCISMIMYDQQSFMAMINSCDTWSTVFHGNDRWWSCMNCYDKHCS